ncbi:MAG: bifunctional methionine sulfoxide reductase B/A protein [Candidatus Zixiibacteriota bacterium]
MKYKKLTPEEERVIIHKGTEMPFTGKFDKFDKQGTYVCKQCGAQLFASTYKFDSGCGWPSFDDAIEGAVRRTLDADGVRMEITCANCGGHLGHVFVGERLTDKNTRYCVNSISMDFIPASSQRKVATEKAYFAGGCFWGVEHLLEDPDGVISVRSGYMGGHTSNPTYEQVCTGTTGHAETVEVEYDPAKVDYATLARLFFEIHDPTQKNRQGPDVGTQYRSAVFYVDDAQKKTADSLVTILRGKGYDVATEVIRADKFWAAEDYHQDYYDKTGKQPYCHIYTKRF